MTTAMTLTKCGQAALKAGLTELDGLLPEAEPLLEILGRIKSATCGVDNAFELFDELIDRYGSIENAIVTLKAGKANFKKAPDL